MSNRQGKEMRIGWFEQEREGKVRIKLCSRKFLQKSHGTF